MKTRDIRFLNKTYTVIFDDDDQIEGLRLYINNVGGTLRAMYMSETGNQKRLDKLLRGYSCVPKNGNALDLRAENNTAWDRKEAYRDIPPWGETGERGVTRRKRDNKYVAAFAVDGKTIHVGSFDTLPEAVAARKLKMQEMGAK